jgi:hypothetical protein
MGTVTPVQQGKVRMHKKTWILRGLLILGLLNVAPVFGAQVTLSDTLAAGNYNSAGYSPWSAQQFTTDANAYTVSSVWINISGSTVNPGDLFAYIYDDDGGLPDGPIGTLSGGPVTDRDDYEFTPVGNISLDPSSAYWVVLNMPTAGSYYWAYTGLPNAGMPGCTGVGCSNRNVTGADGTNWPNAFNDWPFQMSVLADEGSGGAVPEPATFLMIAPLAGLALYIRRRRAA